MFDYFSKKIKNFIEGVAKVIIGGWWAIRK